MAAVSPASYIQAVGHSAKSDRLSLGTLLEPGSAADPLMIRGGVKPYGTSVQGSMRVTASGTPDNKSNVAAGSVVIPATNGGAYVGHNDGAVVITHTAAHATLDRIDLVIAQVRDAEVSGVDNDFRIVAVAGTPAGSPVAPATPANSYVLAQIMIRDLASTGGSTVIASGDITDRRVPLAAAGGIIPIPASGLGAVTPHLGTSVWKTDTKQLVVWDGSAWVTVGLVHGAGWDAVLDDPLASLRPQMTYSSTVQGIVSSTPSMGSPIIGLAFVAPPSGMVFITLTGFLESSIVGASAILGWQIRAGASIGSGSVVEEINDDYSLIAGTFVSSGNPNYHSGTTRHLQQALTPGSSYNVRLCTTTRPAAAAKSSAAIDSRAREVTCGRLHLPGV